jgi:streptogramin lyase
MASHRGVGNRYVEMGLPGASEFDRRWRGRDVSGGFAKLSALFQPEISGGLPGSRLEHHCPTISSPRQRGLVVRRFVVLFIAVLAFVLAPWPATAAPPDNFPDRIELPNGFRPEGIESGLGTSFFVGSLADGAIWRGDLRTGSREELAPGATGRVSVGIAYEASRNRLWVAGGGLGFFGAGDVRVYDASSGDLLATFLPPGDVGFLNDVAITHDAVYVTDSFNAQLVRIPLPADGSLPSADSATLLQVTGDFVQAPDVPNLNGIVAKNGTLLVGDSNTGNLFRVDPDTGSADTVDLGGEVLPGPDGLELRGNTLYVVGGGMVTVVRLGPRLASGVVLGEITDPGLDVPTTATVAAGRLWVVNARFTTPPTPATDYWITQLPLRPESG